MPDIKAIYTEKYFHSFIKELTKLSGEYQMIISKILNYKAYELDKLIWENAAESKVIQEYFSESNIEGGYSTETYLRYYLKTLDKTKLREEHAELFKFLLYLEKQHN